MFHSCLCKECKREYNKEYRTEHAEEIKKRKHEYYAAHRDAVLQKQKSYYRENKDRSIQRSCEYIRNHKEQHAVSQKKCYLAHREKYLEQARTYREEHIDEIRKYQRAYHHNRYEADDLWKFSKAIRANIRDCFKRNGWKKKSKTEEIIGISSEEFYKHLLKTYAEQYGEEWDGKTPVHIDHITPIASAKSEEDIIALCHYKNLRLLKAKDNLRKGSKQDYII